jgi:hypothetical protein
VIALQPVYWLVGRIYRKHSFVYCCVLDHVYRAVAWQHVDQIRYNMSAVDSSYHLHEPFVRIYN